LSKRHLSLTNALELFKAADSESKILSHPFISPGREDRQLESVSSTFEISLNYIEADNRRAADLLSLMSFLDRQGIPEYLLTTDLDTPLDFEEAAGVLVAFSLVLKNQYTDSYSLHRLVQVVTQTWIEKRNKTSTWSSRALKAVSARFPNAQFENWPRCAELLPHADTVLHRKYTNLDDMVAEAALLFNVSSYQGRRGRLELAEELARGSLYLRKVHLGEDHPDTLRSLNNLASILLTTGKYEEAMGFESKALELLEGLEGALPSESFLSMGNVAVLLQKEGKFQEAELVQRKVFKEVLRNEDLNTLRSSCKLASILKDMYSFNEAEELYRTALEILKSHFGSNHPETLDCARDLALVLFSKGEDDEASALLRVSASTYRKILGSEHPDTLTTIRNIRLVSEAQANLDIAEVSYREVLEGRRRVLGETHRDTLESITDLAYVLEEEGKYNEAKGVVFGHRANRVSRRVPQMSIRAADALVTEIREGLPYLSIEDAKLWRRDKKKTPRNADALVGGYLLNRLNSRNHVFIIDNSISMRKHWDEAQKLIPTLAYIAKQVDVDGIEVYFTNSQAKKIRKSATDLERLIIETVPHGDEDVGSVLQSVLHEFESGLKSESLTLTRPKSSRGGRGARFASFFQRDKEIRPLTIYIFTDAHLLRKDDIGSTIEQFAETCKQFGVKRQQVGIQFISFGNDPESLAKLRHIDNNLGLVIDIVDHQPVTGNV
jgi:tetratricopeptide (TPR) repeat protein